MIPSLLILLDIFIKLIKFIFIGYNFFCLLIKGLIASFALNNGK